MSLRRFPWGLTLATSIALAILIALGVWQLHRMAWKQGVLAQREAAARAEPVWLPNLLNQARDPASLHQTRVVYDCPGLDQAPFVELYGLKDGAIIYRLISPCRLKDGPYDALLVDRGYVKDSTIERPKVIGDDYPVRVKGVLYSPQAEPVNPIAHALVVQPTREAGQPVLFMERNLADMAKSLGVNRPAPWFLIAETSSNPGWTALTPEVPQSNTEITPARHLSYALTWFGLAVVLIAIYAAMLLRRLKEP